MSFNPSELRGTHLRQVFGESEPVDDLSAKKATAVGAQRGRDSR